MSMLVTACGNSGSSSEHHKKPTPTPTATPTPTPPNASLSGVVQGGTAPISGSAVTLYAAGSSGYGSGAMSLGSATTDDSGGYTIAYNAPSTPTLLYVVAAGGDAGADTNTAIKLLAIEGESNAIPPSVTVNEFTTVATEFALQQFIDSSGAIIGAPSSNATGFADALNQLNENLADSTTGSPGALLESIAATCTGGTPNANCGGLEQMNTLANILASCVQTETGSSQCSSLLTDATPPGGQTPLNTLAATADIVRNPANNAATLFALQPAGPPFTPNLTAAPDSFILALNFAPAAADLDGPGIVAIDSGGNVWSTNGLGAGVSELTAASAYSTGFNFAPAAAGITNSSGIAIDSAGNVWVGVQPDTIGELTASSGYTQGQSFAPAEAYLLTPQEMAFDDAQNLWIANAGSAVSELTAASGYQTGISFDPNETTFDAPVGLVIDSSDNIWVTNVDNNTVAELLASGGYSTASVFSAAGAQFNYPFSIALDSSANVWVSNAPPAGGGSISELTASSSYADGLNFTQAQTGAEFDLPLMVLDGAANLWVSNDYGNNVSELLAGCSAAGCTGLNFSPPGSNFNYPEIPAVDESGNLWIPIFQSNSITEFVGTAVPVKTPTTPGPPTKP